MCGGEIELAQHRPVQREVRCHDRCGCGAFDGVDDLQHAEAVTGLHDGVRIRGPLVGVDAGPDHDVVGVVPQGGCLDGQLLVVVGHQSLLDQVARPEDLEACGLQVAVDAGGPVGSVVAIDHRDRLGSDGSKCFDEAVAGLGCRDPYHRPRHRRRRPDGCP